MCGFIAIINSKENDDKLKKSFLKLKKINNHRGPDDVKIIHRKNYSLLFRRLEIIDLHKRSAQPFTDQTGKIHLLFNGEIYNYLELKKKLIDLNIKFKTKSDTEVIMQSYKFWGPDFIQKLRGMFSIIILDNIKNRFLCYRDRLGQKPLYYSKYENGLVLSSEIKDIILLKKRETIKENKDKILRYLNVGQDIGNETFFIF
jgi:asparagine synthase (glutamine-hydrolysing)